jgi:hypothetical protein
MLPRRAKSVSQISLPDSSIEVQAMPSKFIRVSLEL